MHQRQQILMPVVVFSSGSQVAVQLMTDVCHHRKILLTVSYLFLLQNLITYYFFAKACMPSVHTHGE